MKKICFLILFLLLAKSAMASTLSGANNKFGMHVAVPHEDDLAAVAKLVNSHNGQWGYITLVIQDNDLDTHKWQKVFDSLREHKLIPIVRLATSPEGENWQAAKREDSQKWVNFLNSLHWVIKNRYVVLFNEPNHATEWGGAVNALEYAKVALKFAKDLKKSNPDYFIMLAGLDQAAPEQLPKYQSAPEFTKTVFGEINTRDFEKYFNGWCSHSYPNPGFSASPQNTGWGSIAGYTAELELLKTIGVNKQLPVFITETGWTRQNLGEELVAKYLVWVYNNVWLPDTRIAAVTPFILNYQSEPFLDFSWQKPASSQFYPQYKAIYDLKKIKGQPAKNEKITFLNFLPKNLVQDSTFIFKLKFLNLGQGIWDAKNSYQFKLISQTKYNYRFGKLENVKPFDSGEVVLKFCTPKALGKSQIKIGLYDNDRLVAVSKTWPIIIKPLQSLQINYRLLSWQNTGQDFQVNIFDKAEQLVFTAKKQKGEKGKINLKFIRNVALGEKYRVVLLKPGYLPRQTFVVFKEEEPNIAKFRIMLPFDFNKDGKLALSDLVFWR